LKRSPLQQQDCLNVDVSATLLRELFRALEIAGISIHLALEERSESERLQLCHRWCREYGPYKDFQIPEKKDREARYVSKTYLQLLKDDGWWPSSEAYGK